MVDRTARDRLAQAIEAFLADDIGALELDDRINEIAGETEDETVHEVVDLLWYHYDDIKDHKVVLDRVEWDYFQRLLLLLRSDASLIIERHRAWRARQVLALAVLVVGGFLFGFGWELLLIAIVLGAVSRVARYCAASGGEDDDHEFARLTPYASISELLAVRRSVPAFRKERYPEAMKWRRIRGPLATAFLWVQAGAMWIMLSPFILPLDFLFQALPQSKIKSRVVPA
jgi:hypothetical protein